MLAPKYFRGSGLESISNFSQEMKYSSRLRYALGAPWPRVRRKWQKGLGRDAALPSRDSNSEPRKYSGEQLSGLVSEL